MIAVAVPYGYYVFIAIAFAGFAFYEFLCVEKRVQCGQFKLLTIIKAFKIIFCCTTAVLAIAQPTACIISLSVALALHLFDLFIGAALDPSMLKNQAKRLHKLKCRSYSKLRKAFI